MDPENPSESRAKWDDRSIYDMGSFVSWVLREGKWFERFQGGQWDWIVVKRWAQNAADWSRERWKPGALPLMTFVKRGIEMRLQTLLKSAFDPSRSVEADTFSNRDLEELDEMATAADVVLRPIMERDEIEVLKDWAKGQGRAGMFLLARVAAETAEELAAKHGLSVSQVHRILSTIGEVAKERFSG